MFVKTTIYVEVNEKDYPNLKQSEIRRIVKEVAESGHVNDYILDNVKSELESQ